MLIPCIALGVLGVYIYIHIYIYAPSSVARVVSRWRKREGGGRRGNGIELKVTDAPAPVSLPRLL